FTNRFSAISLKNENRRTAPQLSSVAYALVGVLGAVLPLKQLVCELFWPSEYLRQRPRPPAQETYQGYFGRPNLKNDGGGGADGDKPPGAGNDRNARPA